MNFVPGVCPAYEVPTGTTKFATRRLRKSPFRSAVVGNYRTVQKRALNLPQSTYEKKKNVLSFTIGRPPSPQIDSDAAENHWIVPVVRVQCVVAPNSNADP